MTAGTKAPEIRTYGGYFSSPLPNFALSLCEIARVGSERCPGCPCPGGPTPLMQLRALRLAPRWATP